MVDPEFLLKQQGNAAGHATLASAPAVPGKQTRVGGDGAPSISKSAIERVRARSGEHVEVGGVTYVVEQDGSFRAPDGKVIAPRGAAGRKWIYLASELARKKPIPKVGPNGPVKPPASKPKKKAKPKAPATKTPKPWAHLAPDLSAAKGRMQFWIAVKSLAEIEIDPKARARWEKIKNQYHPSVHAQIDAKMQSVVRGLSRSQLADFKRSDPGRAVRWRDAQHIAGDHVVKTGVLAPPNLGPNSLLNFVIGDLGINRKIQRELEVAAGGAAKAATAKGEDPKRAGIDAAKALSKKHGASPGMTKLAEAEDRIAKEKPAAEKPPAAKPAPPAKAPAVPKVKNLKLRMPGLSRMRSAGRGGLAMLAQIVLGWVFADQIAKQQQRQLEQMQLALTPEIEAAMAAQAKQLANLWEANPKAPIYVNIRLAYDVETERNEDGTHDYIRGMRLVGVDFSNVPADETPKVTQRHVFWGWITTTQVATSSRVDVDRLGQEQ